MAKPSKLPAWDTTEVNSTEPDSTHQDEGWLAPGGIPEKPPFQTFNHWMNATWQWLKEFNRQGIVEWDGITTYEIDDITKGSDGKQYQSLIGTNTNNNPTTNPDKWIETQWRNQPVTHDITSDADYTLTATQNKYGRIIVTDTGVLLTVARNIVLDNIKKSFIVVNETLQILTFKTSAGTGVAVLPGDSTELYNDGTNVTPVGTSGNGKNAVTSWVVFDGSATPPTILDSYNVSDVARISTGLYEITFEEVMSNANYGAEATQAPSNDRTTNINTVTTSTYRISNQVATTAASATANRMSSHTVGGK